MKHVIKWIFVVLFISSLTSFVKRDKQAVGLRVGEMAPDFSMADSRPFALDSCKGGYVLLSFWASYDAPSRLHNAQLNNVLPDLPEEVRMVSVSFDDYRSIFRETVREDRLRFADCYWEKPASSVYELYELEKGFANYLLDADGVIVAKNVSASELSSYFN